MGGVRGADYLIKRTTFAVITVFVAITINFFLFRVLPRDAVANVARVPSATPELRTGRGPARSRPRCRPPLPPRTRWRG
jgi:ABC-type dipeptide/oligopeptide/nickel transport system permease component